MAGAEDAGLAPGSPELRRLNLAMLAAGLAAFSLLYFTQALLPALGRAFAVGPASASLTVSVATGTLALALIPLSSLAETVGRTPVMRVGLVTACLLAVASAAAPQFWMLLVLRALLGVALGGVIAVAVGHLGDEVRASAAGGAIGIYVSGNSLGGVAGRLIPGVAQQATSWRIAIVILAACAAAAVAVFIGLLPPARQFSPTPPALSAHLRALGDLWRDPGIRRLCAVAFLLMGGFVACYNYLTFRLTAPPIGLSSTLASLLFLAYLAGTVSSPLAGRFADRFGRRRLVWGALALAVAGLALTLPDSLPCITIGLLAFTAGFFAAHSVASSWVAGRASAHRGQAAALYLMGYYLGSSALGSLVGIAYERSGWGTTVAVIGSLYLACAWFVGGIAEPGQQ
jgi:YNFM family putative membrane transporter